MYTQHKARSFCRRPKGRTHFRSGVEMLEARRLLAIALDSAFGIDGLVTTDFTDGGNDEGRAIVVQDNGMLVVAGVAGANRESDKPVDMGGGRGGGKGGGSDMGEPDEPLVPDFALARYGVDGVLDTFFGDPVDPLYPELGQTGKTVTDFGTLEVPTYDEANGVVMLPDGGILLVGSTRAELEGPADFALARYTPAGVLDWTVTTDFGGDDVAKKVAIQENKLVVVGSTLDPEGTTGVDFAVARYDLNGNLDASFGPNGTGMLTLDFYEGKDEGVDVIITPDNEIIVVGHIKDDSRVEPQVFGGPLDIGLAQFDSNGVLDTDLTTGFGSVVLDPLTELPIARTGMVSTDLNMYLTPDLMPEYSTDEAWAGVLDEAGNILVTGRFGAKGVSDFMLVRYTPLGELDTTFGMEDPDDSSIQTGIVHTDIADGPDACYDLAIQASGDILVAGRATSNDKFGFAMVRYTPEGAVGEKWFMSEHFDDGPDQASTLAITGTNTVVLAGWASIPTTMVDFGLAGLTVSGGSTAVPDEPLSGADPDTDVVDEVFAEADEGEGVAPPPGWSGNPGNFPGGWGGWKGAPGKKINAPEPSDDIVDTEEEVLGTLDSGL